MAADDKDPLDAYLDDLTEEISSLDKPEARVVLRGLCGEILGVCARAVYDQVRADFVVALQGMEQAGMPAGLIDDRRAVANAVLDRVASVGKLPEAPTPFLIALAPEPGPPATPPFVVEDMSEAPAEQIEAVRDYCRGTA